MTSNASPFVYDKEPKSLPTASETAVLVDFRLIAEVTDSTGVHKASLVKEAKERLAAFVETKKLKKNFLDYKTLIQQGFPDPTTTKWEEHERAWYLANAEPIIDMYLSGTMLKTMPEGLTKTHMINYFFGLANLMETEELEYSPKLANGKISFRTLWFFLQCKILILMEHWFPSNVSQDTELVNFLKSKNFNLDYETLGYNSRNFWKQSYCLPSASARAKRKPFLTFTQIYFNVYHLQKTWKTSSMSVKIARKVLMYIHLQVARLICCRFENTDILDGLLGSEITQISINNNVTNEDSGNGSKTLKIGVPIGLSQKKDEEYRYTLTNSIKDEICLTFMALYSGLKEFEDLYGQQWPQPKPKNYVVVEWKTYLKSLGSEDLYAKIPKGFNEFFERVSNIIAIPEFRVYLLRICMLNDLSPGETEIFFKRNQQVPALAPKEIFQKMRSVTQIDFWSRRALENINKIAIQDIVESGRTDIYAMVLVRLFNSVMHSKFKISWRDECFFTEQRFVANRQEILQLTRPIIVQIKDSYYVKYYEKNPVNKRKLHHFVFCHTMDRAIFMWILILQKRLSYNYDSGKERKWIGELHLFFLEMVFGGENVMEDGGYKILKKQHDQMLQRKIQLINPPEQDDVKTDKEFGITVDSSGIIPVYMPMELEQDDIQQRKEAEEEAELAAEFQNIQKRWQKNQEYQTLLRQQTTNEGLFQQIPFLFSVQTNTSNDNNLNTP